MNKYISIFMQLTLKYVAEGGTLAEEVISTIRTAQAFGTQKKLADIYDRHIVKSRDVNLKAAACHGFAMAVFFFVIYSAYALGRSPLAVVNTRSYSHRAAFSFGTTLINRGFGQ
jgi:ATP-binding cassette subfamily B (MDR/TAP) protein 1